MTTINRLVLDLSHWNTVDDFEEIARSGIVAVIHKATEGDYNTDETYASRRREAEDAGLKWGAYHFGTDDPVDAQVSRFLSVVGPAIDNDDILLALDFEDLADRSMSLDQARDFVERLEEKTGRPNGVVLYSGNRIKDLLGATYDPFWAARRLWLAHYSSSPTCQASWEKPWLWQYTDGEHGPEPHTCPGCGGPVDGDSFAGTAAELFDQWSGLFVVPEPIPPEPEPAPEPDVIEIMIRLTVPAGTKVEVEATRNGKPPER